MVGKNAQSEDHTGLSVVSSPAQAWKYSNQLLCSLLTPWYTMISQSTSLQTSRTGHSTPYLAPQVMSRAKRSPLSNCWNFSYWYSSECFWSLPPGCISGSRSILYTRTCRFISTKLFSNWSDPSMCWWIGLFLHPRCSILYFSVKLEVIPVNPMLQPVEIFLKGSTTHWYVSHSSQFYILSTLGVHFVPSQCQ